MSSSPVVVKVGGSLFDLPDLGQRLKSWLDRSAFPRVVLVPGGGPTAEAVRQLDRWQKLGEETAHWLALRALALNARFLAGLLPNAVVVGDLEGCSAVWRLGQIPVLDAHEFASADEGRSGCLPHCWEVTSDSVAARLATVVKARRLILLKSVTIPAEMDWVEAGQRGFVDHYFATIVGQGRTAFEVSIVNLREWRS